MEKRSQFCIAKTVGWILPPHLVTWFKLTIMVKGKPVIYMAHKALQFIQSEYLKHYTDVFSFFRKSMLFCAYRNRRCLLTSELGSNPVWFDSKACVCLPTSSSPILCPGSSYQILGSGSHYLFFHLPICPSKSKAFGECLLCAKHLVKSVAFQ